MDGDGDVPLAWVLVAATAILEVVVGVDGAKWLRVYAKGDEVNLEVMGDVVLDATPEELDEGETRLDDEVYEDDECVSPLNMLLLLLNSLMAPILLPLLLFNPVLE